MATEGVLASSWLTMEDRLPTLTQSWAVQWGPLWNVRKLYRKSGHVATNKDSDDCTKNKQHHPIEIWWATCVICEGWSLRVKLTAASFSVIFQVQLHLQAFLQQIYFKSNTSFVTLWQEFACGFLFSFLFWSVVETKTHLSEEHSPWLNIGDTALLRVHIKFQFQLLFEIRSSSGSEYSIVKLLNTCFKHKLLRTFGSHDQSKSPNKQVPSFS